MTEAQMAAIAGEHLVAHKIAMLGFIPTLLRQRVGGIDLLVSAEHGEKTVAIQVKSAFDAMQEKPGPGSADAFHLQFPLGQRAIASQTQTMFFCFVDLRRQNPASTPDVYVVPAAVLRKEY